MSTFNPKIPFCYLVVFSASDVSRALAMETAASSQSSFRRICGDVTASCSLDASAACTLVEAVDHALLRYRAALLTNVDRSIVKALTRLFWLFHDAIEARCELVAECVCSWELRLDDAGALTSFLDATARAYWRTGAQSDWMVRQIECLACNVTNIAERHGIPMRFAPDNPSIEARADRLAVRLFDMANDLGCGNWGRGSGVPDVPGG